MTLREAINNFYIDSVYINNKKVKFEEKLLDKEGVIGINTDGNCNSYLVFFIMEEKTK